MSYNTYDFQYMWLGVIRHGARAIVHLRVTVTAALADFDGSATLTAVTVTVAGEGTADGAL